MNLSLIKIQIIRRLLNVRNLYMILGVAVIIGFGILGLFLYQYFYQTITQSERVILLKHEVAPDAINMQVVSRVVAFMDSKSSMANIEWDKIKNPFIVNTTTTPAILSHTVE